METKEISAKVIADSKDNKGNRITSFILTYPRFIHSELMTHRMFSRNSASSRAIPFGRMLKMVEEDMFIPYFWQKHHKGMQGTEYITSQHEIISAEIKWIESSKSAIERAIELHDDLGVSKQIVNRLLEPYMWHTVLVTATEFDNFFELRLPSYEIDLDKLNDL